MTTVRAFLIVTTVFVFAVTASAQSIYFDDDRGGFGVAASYSNNESIDGFALTLGGSTKGNFDTQFSIGRFTAPRAKVTALSVGLAYYPVKSGSASPIGTGLIAGLQHNKTSYDGYWSDYSSNGTAITAGLTLYRRADVSPKVSVFPFIAGYFLAVIDGGGDGTGVFEAGLSLSSRTSERGFLVVTPAISIDREYVTFSIELGMAFQSRLPSF